MKWSGISAVEEEGKAGEEGWGESWLTLLTIQ